jgi:phosphatidylserine/phosphatidylglycerophosphate/cardiolipin synthase-like enzyme
MTGYNQLSSNKNFNKYIPTHSLQSNPSTSTVNTNINSSNIEYYFSEEHQEPDQHLISVMNSANSTLDIEIYSLTKKDIVNAIADAKKRGINVRVMTDAEQSRTNLQKEELQRLKDVNIPIKINSHKGILHDKVTIADGKIVTTGSFNYTSNATYDNDENLVIIHDTKIAGDFDKEFNAMWNDASRFSVY